MELVNGGLTISEATELADRLNGVTNHWNAIANTAQYFNGDIVSRMVDHLTPKIFDGI